MKNNTLFLLTIVMVLSVASCKKKVETCKLGKAYISDGNTTPNANTFSYYSDGKLQKVVYADKTKDSVAYSADTIYIRTYDVNDSVISLFAGVLNSNGDVVSGVKDNLNYSGSITSTDIYSLEYNAEGKLTKKTITNSLQSTLLNLNYDGGNTATGNLFIGGVLDRSYTFYHNTIENKTGVDDMNAVFTPYFGRPSQNLLDSMRIVTAADDTIRVQYSHTLDANEYVSKTTQTFLTTNADTRYSTYQYFGCSK